MDKFTFFFLFSSQGSFPRVAFSFSEFNLKYKTKLQWNFSFEAFSLAEIQYKNLQCCEFMSYYRQCTMGTFLLCSIYVYPSRWPSKSALSNYVMSASVMKKTSYSTFRHNLLQHLGEHSISTELLRAARLLSSTKPAWISALENLHGFSFLFFPPLLFCEIFLSSSSSRPYQYITVVFRNSLPSAREDTQEPRISQQRTSC